MAADTYALAMFTVNDAEEGNSKKLRRYPFPRNQQRYSRRIKVHKFSRKKGWGNCRPEKKEERSRKPREKGWGNCKPEKKEERSRKPREKGPLVSKRVATGSPSSSRTFKTR